MHLLVVVTSDRGLAAGFNSNLIRAARLEARRLMAEGKTVKFITVGRKARDGLKPRIRRPQIIESFTGISGKTRQNQLRRRRSGNAARAGAIRGRRLRCLRCCSITSSVRCWCRSRRMPAAHSLCAADRPLKGAGTKQCSGAPIPYEFEPEESEILDSPAAAQSWRPDLPRPARQRGGGAGGAHDGDGQRDAQRRRP